MHNSDIGKNIRSLVESFDKASNVIKKSPSIFITEGYLSLIFAKKATKTLTTLVKDLKIDAPKGSDPIALMEMVADKSASRSLRVTELRKYIEDVKAIKKEAFETLADNTETIRIAKRYLSKNSI